ncbi:CotH kinase family protein [Flavobacterium luteum]|uniref:T9SS type A sorting domain-containing protein n=1 Tax=Flavobacterium luteum TaxID=2026654 RepID=A0A7J5AFA3_9FLAO|nr:CotH kinase family protein [Flavobacterium luteum]KAB1156277.1 T9SS type A sorting domain-containing protein [Flavobacterium luteum]
MKFLLFKTVTFFSKLILVLLLSTFYSGFSQILTSSNLPIVIITTNLDPNTNENREITDDYRIFANLKIIKHPDGTTNYFSDINTPQYLNYDGKINIEIRGSFSQLLPKKQYGFSTLLEDNSNNNISLLDMPKENDWILNSLAFDPSLIRDYLSYNLSRQMGNYATRAAYCEVIINNEYKGLYLLQEKIKADSNRVDILKMTITDNVMPNITGGYIIKADKTTGGDPVAWNMPSYSGQTDFIYDSPKPEEITTQQKVYIKGQFFSLASSSNSNNSSFSDGYPSFIDVPSFIDFMISNELASNVDGYKFSTYFHKDRNGKLRAGPIWDFNLTYGNDLFDWGYDRSKTDVWQFSNGDNEGSKFWTDLFNNPTYKCYLSKRWNQLLQAGQPLNDSSLVQFIDSAVSQIKDVIVRENQKWETIPNHALEIQQLKTFLELRISWITKNLGSFSSCNSFNAPALVINKINYHPLESNDFPESNDLEFIEIKNTGLTTINLTGYYFKELGLTYVFPANSTILANQSAFLASNSSVFKAKYGITAFGQFTRNLSNSTQKLVLVDAFGNAIDSVEYSDILPWPDADGNGSYLQLINTNLDNSLPTSWVASNDETLTNFDFLKKDEVSIYPNPTSQIVNIHSKKGIEKVEVFDVLGSLIFSSNKKSDSISIDFSSYSKGIYFVTVFNELGITTEKIVKF